MLDPWIIEEIRRREEERRRRDERLIVEIPMGPPREREDHGAAREDRDKVERGVVIVELMG